MRHFALSAVGRDRPGIVARVAELLLEHGGNIEDSQMTILRGHFAMTLIVSAPAAVDAGGLRAGLAQAGEALGLEAVSLSEVTGLDTETEPEPSHVVSVYGVDHPGIVHAVSAKLAEHEVTITDLTTRLVETAGAEPLYAMIMEVALPAGLDPGRLEQALDGVRAEQTVDLTFRELSQDVL
jgi:glycine cleavage system transcriptional repressor